MALFDLFGGSPVLIDLRDPIRSFSNVAMSAWSEMRISYSDQRISEIRQQSTEKYCRSLTFILCDHPLNLFMKPVANILVPDQR